MYVPFIALIIGVEILVVLAAGCAFLGFWNRRSRNLRNRLQARMHELVAELREEQSRVALRIQSQGAAGYSKNIENQLALTREHHQSLAGGQDIALDLDSEAPLPRRIAALRYALLVAERDALGDKTDDVPDWSKLEGRYRQLMEYYIAGESEQDADGTGTEEVKLLQEELQSYKKRVVNLERFKALYFELESRWESSKEKAQKHYDELSEMGSQLDDSAGFGEALDNYHDSYRSIGDLVEAESDQVVANSASARAAQQATSEIRHLRNVAADQHRIIHDLQLKLAEATSEDETSEVVKLLQAELEKQLRYSQESETCIQLLEDELANAHREAEQARSKLQQLGLAKAEAKDLQAKVEEQEKSLLAMKGENQRLKNKLRNATKTAQAEGGSDPRLKKELTDLQRKYADLEERYLDLKLQE